MSHTNSDIPLFRYNSLSEVVKIYFLIEIKIKLQVDSNYPKYSIVFIISLLILEKHAYVKNRVRQRENLHLAYVFA